MCLFVAQEFGSIVQVNQRIQRRREDARAEKEIIIICAITDCLVFVSCGKRFNLYRLQMLCYLEDDEEMAIQRLCRRVSE